ncbi:hypothetical protein EDE15_2976 [Edaphobacter aggregans]|uniref:PH (Pleckstrin Homology) domain-containing protein n=2 Tax=Edaphobacter aggregans TaxID=570835 RepID=A0A3R9NZG3_9BACT|nr:hypothetical protein EDE15_2976 [Edaphobacter aggregans]
MQVLFTRQRRWIDFLVEALVIAGLAFLFWRNQSWIVLLMLVVAIGHGVVGWLGDDHAELLITKEGIEVIGTLGRISSSNLRLQWSSISGLDYREGGEDEPSGLYARLGSWSSTRLMTHVNKEQAEEIIAAIYRRFPYVEMAEDSGGWSLFSGGSEIMTLGLSKSDESSSRK